MSKLVKFLAIVLLFASVTFAPSSADARWGGAGMAAGMGGGMVWLARWLGWLARRWMGLGSRWG